jgi:hypothetical protein
MVKLEGTAPQSLAIRCGLVFGQLFLCLNAATGAEFDYPCTVPSHVGITLASDTRALHVETLVLRVPRDSVLWFSAYTFEVQDDGGLSIIRLPAKKAEIEKDATTGDETATFRFPTRAPGCRTVIENYDTKGDCTFGNPIVGTACSG